MLKAGKLSHLIKEIKQNNRKEQPKVTKKGETTGKDKAMAILMVQPRERVARQRITQIVRSPSPYNRIIGRPGVRKLQAVPSTVNKMLKIPIERGVITLKSSSLLQQNLDVFAWKPADMTGIPRNIAEHRLNVRKGCSSVRQKKRGQAADRNQANQEKVGKTLKTKTKLPKTKDGYPLPQIDWKVESLCGFPFKCFLDAYKGYHQIQMAKKDEEKTAFIRSQGIFCYTKMPFGMRNAGANLPGLVDKRFYKDRKNPSKYM
ncbi:hypothetical protein Tco_0630930 [Tanacetum coccineum]